MLRKILLAVLVVLSITLFLNYSQLVFAKKPASKTIHKSAPHKKPHTKGKAVKGIATSKEVPIKNEVTIAVYGDSMIDTMGEAVDYLGTSLHAKYPGITFHLYNYGIGGQNVQQGLDRFNNTFAYQTRTYPSISDIHPDIIILGSFSYNPFSPYDRNRHWTTLSQLIEKAKSASSNVFMLAEIAPLGNSFGKGPHGVNWPEEMANTQSGEIKQQLENAISLGATLSVPVVNAYYPTIAAADSESSTYTNTDDGIHPSIAGHIFTADLISQALHDTLVKEVEIKPTKKPKATPKPKHN